MKGYFAAPPRSEDEIAAIVKNYRNIALACGILLLVFGVVRALTQPEGQDPPLERMLVSLLCFAYAGFSLIDGPVRRHPIFLMTTLCCVIFAYATYLAYLTQFSVNSCFSILLGTFVISLVITSRLPLLCFQFMACTLTLGTMVSMPEVTVSPLFFVTTLCGVCVFTYINQSFRMNTEANLRLAQSRAEEAAEARTQFLANMSHEIRTPMNGVIGMTHLLSHTELDATQESYLKTIQISGESLLNIINDILDFSKVDAGEITLELRQFDLIECLENAAELVKQSCHDKRLNLYLTMASGVPQSAFGDSNRLRQVVINLLNNAIKFTAEGSVTLKATCHHHGEDLHLTCSVTDTGIGIEKETTNRLFEAFSQADTSTTREYGGTGLGLSISKHLIELMGGSIHVESEVGIGSTFSFCIPIREPLHHTRDQALEGAVSHLRADPPKVLMFIENPQAHESLEQFLIGNEIPFKTAPSRCDIPSLMREGDYPMVLSDAQFTKDIMSQPEFIFVASDINAHLTKPPYRVINQPVNPSQIREQILLHANQISESSAVQHSSRLDTRELRILLAEDNQINQRVATKMLEKYGFDVDLANNGTEALEAIRKEQYDLVLMDIQMPELSGLEVTQRVREEGNQCPIIALTASAFEEDREACLSAGMDAYLSKPIRSETLDNVIRQTLNQASV